jgi:hypothetical protein
MHVPALSLVLVVAGSLLLGLPLAQDKPATDAAGAAAKHAGVMSLNDGRFVVGKPMTRKKGGVVVHYDAADVLVPDRLILDCFPTKSEVEHEPKNDKEKEYLAKGLVPVGGKWLSKAEAERQIAVMAEKQRKRVAEQKAHTEWRNRHKVKGKTFDFEHNVPIELFEDLKELFEVYYETFTKKWGKKTQLKNKPVVHIYANHDDFATIGGLAGGVIGWYHPLSNKLHLYWDRSDPDLTTNVLFHEGNHMLSDMINGDFEYSAWIEEPMAEYWGASRWNPHAANKAERLTTGHLLPGRIAVVRAAVRDNKWVKLTDLIHMERFGAYEYAWGWTFVHFLMSSARYAKQWEKYYLDLAHKKDLKREFYGGSKTISPDEQERLLVKYLGVENLEAIEKEWHAYVKQLDISDYDLSGLERAGRYMYRMIGDHKEAKRYLEKAAEKGAKSAYTYSTLADLLTKGKEQPRAVSLIDKAIELEPLEPEFYYQKGRLLAQKGPVENKKEAKKWLQLAAEIEPDNWTYAAAALENLEQPAR